MESACLQFFTRVLIMIIVKRSSELVRKSSLCHGKDKCLCKEKESLSGLFLLPAQRKKGLNEVMYWLS